MTDGEKKYNILFFLLCTHKSRNKQLYFCDTKNKKEKERKRKRKKRERFRKPKKKFFIFLFTKQNKLTAECKSYFDKFLALIFSATCQDNLLKQCSKNKIIKSEKSKEEKHGERDR